MSFGRLARSAETGQSSTRTSPAAGKSSLTLQLSAQPGTSVSPDAESAVEGTNGLLGSPLPTNVRQQFEGSLMTDLSRVRVHTGAESNAAASAVGAQAFATGDDIHFAAGRYQPDDPFGMHLLAHEVAHTVQQSSGAGASIQCKPEVSQPGDAAEVDADRAADAMTRDGDILQRAIEARDRNDLAAMKTVNARAREMRAASFSDPPKPASDALHTIRTHLMEKVAELVDAMDAKKRENGASVDTARTEDQTASVEAAETELDGLATPYLEALLTGDPQYRYYHPNRPDVQNKVAQALRIHSSNRGLAQIGHRAAAEQEARTTGKLPDGSWCGAFAYTQQAKAGGMDPYWRSVSLGEAGIRGALTYGYGSNPWIWAEGDWHKLKDYHAQRGSLRHYITVGTQPPADISAGDIVLIDNARGMDPDHIQLAVAYDGRFLRVMGGNQGTDAATDENGVSRSDTIDITRNKTANDVRQRDAAGNPIAGTTDKSLKKNVRLHGVGRWSLVDFEQHIFSTSAKKPAPPSSKELGKVM